MNQKTNWSQFGTLITVFFFWGFVAASNDILIPVFKKAFTLTQLQSQLVAVAFYVAYTVGSLIYVGVSSAIDYFSSWNFIVFPCCESGLFQLNDHSFIHCGTWI
jgi:fucose permease